VESGPITWRGTKIYSELSELGRKMNLDLFPQHHAPALHVSPRTDNTMTMVMEDLVMVHSIRPSRRIPALPATSSPVPGNPRGFRRPTSWFPPDV